jgi:ERCC4-related helicase
MSTTRSPRLALRPYQQRIGDSVNGENAIIKMPTGSGKTFVASELIKRSLAAETSKVALFLVPTCDLVDQQARAISEWCDSCGVRQYHGGMSDPHLDQHNRILVSTPLAFYHLQWRNCDFDWSRIGICIFDEVHHVLKDHPYRKIAKRLQNWKEEHGKSVHVVGLSASLTYAVADVRIHDALDRLCQDLSITKMESPTPEGVLPVRMRRPHKMHETFMNRVKNRTATPFALRVWDTVQLLEKHAETLFTSFTSPLLQEKLASWEDYASQLKVTSLPNIRESGRFFQQLEHWYVALRLVVLTWEEDEQLVMQWLKIENALFTVEEYGSSLESKLNEMNRLANNSVNFMKMACLREQLVLKKNMFGSEFRCIIFVQERIKAYILAHWLNRDVALRHDHGIEAGFVASKGSRLTPSIKATRNGSIDKFRTAEINVLVATSVIEEVSRNGRMACCCCCCCCRGENMQLIVVILLQGFDVPAANVVVAYDPLKDTVELSQRFGRARQTDSAIVVMDERFDRPISKLEAVRDLQDEIIGAFDPSKTLTNQKSILQSQIHREKNVRDMISDRAAYTGKPMAILNVVVQKTKGHLDETLVVNCSMFTVQFKYSSMLRSIEVERTGASKKLARAEAAKAMLDSLRNALC